MITPERMAQGLGVAVDLGHPLGGDHGREFGTVPVNR